MLSLGIPGAIGAFIGATFLANFDGDVATPVTSAILLFLGLWVTIRFAFLSNAKREEKAWEAKKLVPLGLFDDLPDPTGGGGWGPVITLTLLGAEANQPRKIIDTVPTAGFLASLAAVPGFLPKLREELTQYAAPVIGLLRGGVIVAPLTVYLMGRIGPRLLGIAIDDALVGLNIRTLFSPLVSGGVLATVLLVRTFVVITLVLQAHSHDTLPDLHQRVQLKSASQSSPTDVSSLGSPSLASTDAGAEDVSEDVKVGAKNGVHVGGAGVS